MSENSNRKQTRGVIIIIQIYKLFEFFIKQFVASFQLSRWINVSLILCSLSGTWNVITFLIEE